MSNIIDLDARRRTAVDPHSEAVHRSARHVDVHGPLNPGEGTTIGTHEQATAGVPELLHQVTVDAYRWHASEYGTGEARDIIRADLDLLAAWGLSIAGLRATLPKPPSPAAAAFLRAEIAQHAGLTEAVQLAALAYFLDR